jgi:hypothetical protein
MAKSIKHFIKKNPEPAGGTNVNPSQLGQYSAKSNISEGGSLDQYLSSKGIDPKSIPLDTKIGHAKSAAYLKWKRDHQMESITLTKSPVQQRQQILDKSKESHKVVRIKEEELDEKCWTGYKPVPGKKPYSKGSCAKEGNQMSQITPEEVVIEDTFADNKAATQTVMAPGEISERKRQMSKSARMIKALYKKHNMKEDMHDHEKEDKSVQTYGKKPKVDKADKEDSQGEKKPAAAMTLTGGTTLTGNSRDTVEIDPMMRNRPGQPDVTKKDDKKKDDKDGKKQEKK